MNNEDYETLVSRILELENRVFNSTSGIILSISENIKPPAKDGVVGYNLVSTHETVIPVDDVVFVKTGVKIKLPVGYWGLITSRSSAVFKHHILVLQGVIDTGYTGELMIPCTAVSKQRILPAGTSIAQLILFPSVTPSILLVGELPITERGETGFGSTGT
jgi:dUTP pyrophosphatase